MITLDSIVGDGYNMVGMQVQYTISHAETEIDLKLSYQIQFRNRKTVL